MTPNDEKQLLQTIYDRIFDAITYQPNDGKNPFTAKETFIHFCKNAAVDTKSFINPKTPANPTGNLEHTEQFAIMVDKVSPMSLEWENSNKKLSTNYSNVINSANATTAENPAQQAQYNKYFNYLYFKKETDDEFGEQGAKIVTTENSPKYNAYITNMNSYVAAITKYRVAYATYLSGLRSSDANKQQEARDNWQATEPTLSNEITNCKNNLLTGDGKTVERALNGLKTTNNDGIRAALSQAQDAVSNESKFASSTGDPNAKWLFSYPEPSDWAEDSPKSSFSKITINTSNTSLLSTETTHKFDVDTSFNFGLFRAKNQTTGNFDHTTSSSSKDNMEISFEVAKVDIMRPWFNESIFSLDNWKTNLKKKGEISNGKIDSSNAQNYIPMYPVSFIVAKNITIKADFSTEDSDRINNSIKTNADLGYGPFSISGNYGYGNSSDKFNSTLANGALTVPGLQIIGWVSRVIPFSAQQE